MSKFNAKINTTQYSSNNSTPKQLTKNNSNTQTPLSNSTNKPSPSLSLSTSSPLNNAQKFSSNKSVTAPNQKFLLACLTNSTNKSSPSIIKTQTSTSTKLGTATKQKVFSATKALIFSNESKKRSADNDSILKSPQIACSTVKRASHSVVYWIEDDQHSTIELSKFLDVESPLDIVEDEEYNVLFPIKISASNKTTLPPSYRARCVYLGNKESCNKQLVQIVAAHVPKPKTKRLKTKKLSTKVKAHSGNGDEDLYTTHSNDLFLENHTLVEQNKQLANKITELESLVDSKQLALDASLGNLSTAENKIGEFMQSFGQHKTKFKC